MCIVGDGVCDGCGDGVVADVAVGNVVYAVVAVSAGGGGVCVVSVWLLW